MSDGTISTGISVDFDDALTTKVDQAAGLQPEPATPTSTALAIKADAVIAAGATAVVPQSGQRETFMCRDMLDEGMRTRAEQIARQQYPKLLADPVALGDFGNGAVDGINQMARRMLAEAGRAANIPELTAITRNLDSTMRSFTRKYDKKSVTKNRDQYDQVKGKVLEFFNKYKDMLHELLRDARGIQAFLDGLTADLIQQRHQLSLNVELCNELYAENEASINKLIAVIAVMEYVRDVAEEAAAAIHPEGQPNARELREERDAIVEFIQAMDVRIGEFKQRLFVAWATGPQIRKIRAISYGLGQRLALLVNLTIPVFRLTVVQWVALEQAVRAGQTAEAVGNATDTALTAWANASSELVPQVAKQIQTPSMRPETITLIADSLAKQAQGIEEAFRFGTQARGEVNAAIVRATNTMDQTSDRHAANMLALVAEARKPFALPAAPGLPDEVKDNADDALSGLFNN